MAFHPYPQVIAAVFNRRAFGPPRGLTPASAWPRIDHPASRPRNATYARHLKDSLSLRLASKLNLAACRDSLAHSTKGTPSHRKVLRPLAGARFQVLFHSPRGVLFTFPSRYWFAIGHRRVFSLGGWSPLLPAGLHLPGGTRVRPSRGMGVRVRGSHPLRPAFPCRSAPASLCHRAPGSRPRGGAARNPRWESPWGFPTHRVWASALSLAATRAISVDFSSSGYLDVSVPRVVLAHPILFRCGWRGITPAGFPHSETRGSKAVSASPRLIAAGRVLLRLPVPRHPPRAHGILAPHRGLELKVSDHGRIVRCATS